MSLWCFTLRLTRLPLVARLRVYRSLTHYRLPSSSLSLYTRLLYTMRASLLLTVLVVLCALVAVSSAFGLRRLPQEYQNDMERRHAEVEEMTKKSALLDEVMRKRVRATPCPAIRKAKTEEFRAIRNEIRADAESRKREREQRIEEAHAKRARMI